VSRECISTPLYQAQNLIFHYARTDDLIPEDVCKDFLVLQGFLERYKSWISPGELDSIHLAWGHFSLDLEEWEERTLKALNNNGDESWMPDTTKPIVPPWKNKGKEKSESISQSLWMTMMGIL